MAFILLLTVFIQCLCYFFIDAKKIKFGKLLVLLFFILIYFVVLPYLFYPKMNDGITRCGMPLLGMYVFFWIIGGGLTILTHLIYYILNRLLARGWFVTLVIWLCDCFVPRNEMWLGSLDWFDCGHEKDACASFEIKTTLMDFDKYNS